MSASSGARGKEKTLAIKVHVPRDWERFQMSRVGVGRGVLQMDQATPPSHVHTYTDNGEPMRNNYVGSSPWPAVRFNRRFEEFVYVMCWPVHIRGKRTRGPPSRLLAPFTASEPIVRLPARNNGYVWRD